MALVSQTLSNFQLRILRKAIVFYPCKWYNLSEIGVIWQSALCSRNITFESIMEQYKSVQLWATKHDQPCPSPGLWLVRADPGPASDWSVVTPAVTTGPTSAQMSPAEFPQQRLSSSLSGKWCHNIDKRSLRWTIPFSKYYYYFPHQPALPRRKLSSILWTFKRLNHE